MSHKSLIISFLFTTLLGMGCNVSAAEKVEFESVLREGMQNNYDIRLQKLAIEKSSSNVLQTQGFTTPYFSFDLTAGEGTDPTVTNEGTAFLEENFVVPTRLGIDFYTGIHVESSENLQPTMNFNNLGVWAGVTMPLLRGLGENSPANTAIQSAEINSEASDQQLSNEIMSYFRDLQTAYLALKHGIDQYDIDAKSLAEAKKHQQGIRKLIAGGALPKVEDNQTTALVIQYEQKLNRTKLSTLNSYYALRQLTGVKDQSILFEMPDAVSNVPEPDLKRVNDLIIKHSSIDDAMIMSTPYYKNASLLSDVEKLQLDKAENQKLNQLDLEVRASWFQMTDTAHYADAFDSEYPGASALVMLNYTLPVKNVQQEGAYLVQQAEYRSSRLNLDQLLFDTKVQIQQIVMSLQLLASHYERDRELVDVREQAWKNEILKFKLGNSTQLDVIQSFDNYFASSRIFNGRKFRIHDLVIKLKYLIGELPETEKQLNDFSLANFFATY